MAWTTPLAWLANKIVSAYQLRIGIGNNLAYLYGIRPPTMTQSADLKAATDRDKSIVYQNLYNKALLCCVMVACGNSPYTLDAYVECDTSNPPTTKVVYSSFSSGYSNDAIGSLFFIVPPNSYYKVETLSGAAAPISKWFEWQM